MVKDVPGCLMVSPGEIQEVEGYRICRLGVPGGRAHCAEDMAVNKINGINGINVFMLNTSYAE
jgi:hypothetical protein